MGLHIKQASLFRPVATFSPNKDYRTDQKQLLLIITVSKDRAVPVHFKVADGNTRDITTHFKICSR
jgi:transposase